MKKVPQQEVKFLADQRDQRKMVLGSLDITTTRKNTKRNGRREKELDHATTTTGNI